MIICLIVVWLLLGVVGYFLMRQGFLVQFESALGEKWAWDSKDIILGIVSIVFGGPIFIIMAFSVQGKRCVKKRVS